MKIKITENENVKEVEISLGLSSKSKSALKAFAEKTINTVVNTGAQVVKKVNDFADKIVEEETRETREYVDEIVKKAKEDAQRIVEEARERYFASTQNNSDETDENEKILFKYLDSLNLYNCEEYDADFTQEAKKFIKAFKYPLTPCSIQAYRVALRVSEISFETIVNEIEILGETREDIIESLKVEFNIWLRIMPDIKINCPDADLIQLLKYFRKKYYHEVTSVQEDLEINQEAENDTSYNFEEDDDYPDEVEEKETLEQKIANIPEGKTFTLAEYLDYTEAYKYDGINRDSYLIAKEFLSAIEFPNYSKATNAFAIMLTLDKPSYKKISQKISGFENEEVIENLKKNFELWLNERADIKKYCPKANLWQLMIYFKKKVYESINE